MRGGIKLWPFLLSLQANQPKNDIIPYAMNYDISLQLPEGWNSEIEKYEESEGVLITHLEARRTGADGKGGSASVEVFVGDMPADTTAEDEAYANYAEIIGWDGDEDDECSVAEWKFMGKKAYGFSGECEDGSIMLLMCQEFSKGHLMICTIVAPDDKEVGGLAEYLGTHLRIKVLK